MSNLLKQLKIANLEGILESGHGKTNKPLSPRKIKEIKEQITKLKQESEEL